MGVSGDLTALMAAAMCALVVTLTEPVAIGLLRRAAAIDVPAHAPPTGSPRRAAAVWRSRPGCSRPLSLPEV